MKYTFKIMAISTIVTFATTSCHKMFDKHEKKDEIKNIELTVALKANQVYNLDLATYGDEDDFSAITQQAKNEKLSILNTSTNPFTGNYSYTAIASIPVDQVVLQITENENVGGNGIAPGGCQSNDSDGHHGKKHHQEITNLTINFTVDGLSVTKAAK